MSRTVVQPAEDTVLGRFEESVLLVTMICGPAASAELIKAKIDQTVGERTITCISTTLERLTLKGMVESDIEESSVKRKRGRPKRLFKVTPEGVESAQRSVGTMYRLAAEAGVAKVA